MGGPIAGSHQGIPGGPSFDVLDARRVVRPSSQSARSSMSGITRQIGPEFDPCRECRCINPKKVLCDGFPGVARLARRILNLALDSVNASAAGEVPSAHVADPTVNLCLIGSTPAGATGRRVSAGDGDCPHDGTYGPFGDEATRVLVRVIIARPAGAAAPQVGDPFLFMAAKEDIHDDTRFTITPPPPVVRATIRSEAVRWEVSWNGSRKFMITAIVYFFLVSLVALDVVRRHEIGRSTSRLRIPGNNATAPATATQAPASDQRSRPVAIGPVQAGEPRRPARGDPTEMTSPRGMQEDHVGAHRAFHEITVDADPANPGPVAGTDPPPARCPA